MDEPLIALKTKALQLLTVVGQSGANHDESVSTLTIKISGKKEIQPVRFHV